MLYKKSLFLVFVFIYPAVAAAQVTLTIPDPFDPLRRFPLDSKGQIECMNSKISEKSSSACAKAKNFYSEQFSNPDLRLSKMEDHIRPHPKNIVGAFLTKNGIKCSNVESAKKKLCLGAKDIFYSYDKEQQEALINELEETLAPTTIVPLAGDLDCSWSKQKKEQYQYCLNQSGHLKKMLFEDRLKHNERAVMIIQLLEAMQRQQRKCKAN